MRFKISVLALLMVAGPAYAQTTPVPGGAPDASIPVRCVNTAGTAFEACGGSGGPSSTVAIDQTTPGTTDSVTVKNSFGLESTQLLQATAAKQDLIITALADLLTELVAKTEPANTQVIGALTLVKDAVRSTPYTSAGVEISVATAANQTTGNTSLSTIASAVHAEDAASADADKGVLDMGQRRDVPGTQTSTDSDYEALQLFQGWLRTLLSTQTPTGDAAVLRSDGLGSLAVSAVVNANPQVFLLACNRLRRTNCR